MKQLESPIVKLEERSVCMPVMGSTLDSSKWVTMLEADMVTVVLPSGKQEQHTGILLTQGLTGRHGSVNPGELTLSSWLFSLM